MRRQISQDELSRGIAITHSHMPYKPFKTPIELFREAQDFNRLHPVGSTAWVRMDHEPCYRPRTIVKPAKSTWKQGGYPVFEAWVSYRLICNCGQCHSSRINTSINNIWEDA